MNFIIEMGDSCHPLGSPILTNIVINNNNASLLIWDDARCSHNLSLNIYYAIKETEGAHVSMQYSLLIQFRVATFTATQITNDWMNCCLFYATGEIWLVNFHPSSFSLSIQLSSSAQRDTVNSGHDQWSMTLRRLSDLLFSFSHKLKCNRWLNHFVVSFFFWRYCSFSGRCIKRSSSSMVRCIWWQCYSSDPQIFTI